MSYSYGFDGGKVVQFDEQGQPHSILLDPTHFQNNYSRVTYKHLYHNPDTMEEMLKTCFDESDTWLPEPDEDEATSVFLANVLLFRLGMRRYQPLRVLELGSSTGSLAYFLARHAAALHEGSRVYCLSEVLPGEHWMRILARLGADNLLQTMNLLTTPQTSGALRDHHYDFTLVHGLEAESEPDSVLQNALRVTKTGGMLVVLSDRPALKGSFEHYCKGGEVYPVGEREVLVADVDARMQELAFEESPEGVHSNHLKALLNGYDTLRALGPLSQQDGVALSGMVQGLIEVEEQCIALAETLDLLDVKVLAIDAKEMLLNRMYTEYDDQKAESEQQYGHLMDEMEKQLEAYR